MIKKLIQNTPFLRLARLVVIVAFFHAGILIFAGITWKSSPKPRKPEKLFIQTISLNHSPLQQETPPVKPFSNAIAEPLMEAPAPSPPLDELPQPVEEPIATPLPSKPKEAKPQAKKESKPAKKPAEPTKKIQKTPPEKPVSSIKDKKSSPVVTAEQKKKEKLLQDAQESLAKINSRESQEAASKQPAVDLPKGIQSLKIDNLGTTLSSADNSSEISSREIHYQDELSLCLRSFLQLPEYGEVKVRLTLKRNGTLLSVKVLKAESEKNRQYLEKTLQTFRFPTFGKSFEGQDQYSFTITLSNEI